MAKSVESRSAPAAELGTLPTWDLSDLYPGPESAALGADLDACAAAAKAFRARYEGNLAALDGAALAEAVKGYEEIQESLGRVMSYGQLVYSGDMSDPEVGRFYQSLQERTTAISTSVLFFNLELNGLDDDEIEAKLTVPALTANTTAETPHEEQDAAEPDTEKSEQPETEEATVDEVVDAAAKVAEETLMEAARV